MVGEVWTLKDFDRSSRETDYDYHGHLNYEAWLTADEVRMCVCVCVCVMIMNGFFYIAHYCFLISADISVLHSICTGSESSPSVQIFSHIATPQKFYCTPGSIIAHLLLHTC